MKKLLFLFMALLLCVSGFAQAIIDPLLSEEMTRRNDDEHIKVIVIMKSQYDRVELTRRANYYATRAERREFVVNELKEYTAASQYDLRRSLSEMQRGAMVTEPTVLWMANALYFDATKAAIQDLARRNDIEMIGFAKEYNWIPDGEEATPATATREITQNIIQVHANQVWELGYTGEGVVVAVIDTGVNYHHVDLADHLWDGGSDFPYHGYDVYNHDNDPIDDMGHGSHCAGTVCGDGTGASQTGMAPDATLMCVKCLDASGNGGAQSISEGIQWAVEHGCDMFSMSLGLPNSTIPDRTLLRHTCEAALDAGVVAAIAAGNEGNSTWMYPIPNNVRVPGSCPPPYMDAVQGENPGGQTCSVCVGAVDYNDAAAYFTSRGPVTWQNTEFGDYPYQPGIGLIRPDVCAPGVDIKSLNYESNTGYTTMSGTSMATPCVAGCMALMLSKDINLTPADVCRILEETALPLSDGKSNTFGFGRVDVFQAVEAIQLGAIRYNSFAINDPEGNNNHHLNPGESVMMALTMDNVTEDPVSNVTVVLATEDPNVTITDNTVDFPNFAPNETLTVENAFAFSVNDQVLANQEIKFDLGVYVAGENTATYSLKVKVWGYLLQYGTTVVLNDDNGNGLLNPGETADLRIMVDNIGNEMAQMVVGTLSTDYEFVTLNETEKPYSTIGAEMMAYADFNVTLDAAAPAEFVIPFTLDLVDAFGRHTLLTINYRNACNIIFSLHDSYGDGWQGNYLTVNYSDGTPSEQMTVNSGSSATYTRELASGCEVSLTWHNGQWTSECSFEVTYEDGTVIYQNSGGFSGTQTFTVYCSGGAGAQEFCNPVRNLAYELVGHDVVLTWDTPESGAPTGYEVYRETMLLTTTTELTYTDADLEEGLYNYCVYAVYDGCQSEFVCLEAEVSVCGPVQNLDYTIDDDLLLTLTWEAPEDPTGLVEYQIFMNEELLTTTNELTYAFTVTEGVHDMLVRAVFANCEKDEQITVCIMGAVENLHFLGTANTANIAWDPMDGVSGYEVYLNGELAATVEEPNYTTSLESGLTVAMVKPIAEGCYTQIASIEICYCDPVTDLTFVGLGGNGMLSFTWAPVADAASYSVYCNGVQYDTQETSIAFEAVVGENTIRVVAMSVYGCASESVGLTQNVCASVDGFDYSFIGNLVTVSWNGDADSYTIRGDFTDAPFNVESNTYDILLEEGGEHFILVEPYYINGECLAIMSEFRFVVTNNAPTIQITEVREGLIAMAWDEVDGAIAYNLYRDGELIAENLTEANYNDTGMVNNQWYCYTAQSVFEKGISDISEPVCANYNIGMDENDGKVSIYPNPTYDKVTVECEGMTSVEIYSVEGKLVNSIKVDNDACQIDGLGNGTYILRIRKGKETIVRSVVKM